VKVNTYTPTPHFQHISAPISRAVLLNAPHTPDGLTGALDTFDAQLKHGFPLMGDDERCDLRGLAMYLRECCGQWRLLQEQAATQGLWIGRVLVTRLGELEGMGT
jgi:hypothetical protein